MPQKARVDPVLWSSLILVAGEALSLYIASRAKVFVEVNQFAPPEVSAAPALGYFFGMAALIGIVLFFIPVAKLRKVLKIIFALLYSWGIFIILALLLPVAAAALIAVGVGAAWLLRARVWLHNLVLILAMVSIGSVFGLLISPWTVMFLLLALSVYDILAVRFGYMLWLAKKLSESDTLPAFIIPRKMAYWNLDPAHSVFRQLFQDSAGERDFSILGGGDIGLPLVLVVSVFFVQGLGSAIIMGAFSVLGLACAYWIQLVLLKGKPMPALPPISVACLIGLLMVNLIA